MGRVFLSAGTILLTGMLLLLTYSIFIDFEEAILAPPDLPPHHGSVGTVARTSSVIWSLLIVLLATLGLAFIFGRLNAFVRRTIYKVAKFIRADIFATELASTGLVWILASLILLFTLPVGAILTGAFLVLNLLCFILARVFYGRKKYTL